ncbi:MAG: helix-turn-helix transcriptional regulator [Erythrobacter sp.]|nr:helix-turn-helix transcriptional regulator [Erythrobacter sp.]
MSEREIHDIMAQVRAAMDAQQVSQGELARRAGLTKGYVSRLLRSDEPDGRPVTLQNALLLAHALGLVTIAEAEEA